MNVSVAPVKQGFIDSQSQPTSLQTNDTITWKPEDRTIRFGRFSPSFGHQSLRFSQNQDDKFWACFIETEKEFMDFALLISMIHGFSGALEMHKSSSGFIQVKFI